MLPASLFVVAQIIFTVFILGASSQPKILQQAKHEVKNVLGVSQLAQDTEAPPPASEAPATEQPPPTEPPHSEPPSNPNPPAPPVNEAPPSTVAPQPEALPSAPSPTQEGSAPAASSPPEPSGSSTSTQETGVITPFPTLPPESSVSQTDAVLNPENVINNAEHIDKESVDAVKKEEDSISQAQTSDEKEKLLITFAKDKVNDIEKNLKQDDFTTTAFATVRLTDTIDRVIQEIQTAPAAQSAQLKQKVSDFCREADLKLRNQELSVPEESEQDMEISRAKCFDYQ